ncbi:MAG: hypothetical protein ACRDQX_01745 [Pseudonocardiaceae bacterium]
MTTIPPPGGYSAGQAPLRAPRPQEVEISFWLWIATFVLGVVGLITNYSQIRAEAINQVLAQTPAADQSTIESATTTALVIGVVLGLLFAVAEIVFVFLMRGGRNWARIVLAVFGGLGVLFGLLGLAVNPGAGSATGLLQLLLLIGALVTMFLPAANAWFRRS